ncbi:membrane protein [Ophiostoma piceae UAMH 11346]|uniref:Membrane protein n=1 Tax=Ophiostoma piceae (strain UAMH 11346) TaxID=1262450 RepID=S3BUC6_OPHP1|nr:membrane protein [Ophiostoma piceae UAMH 11346]
MSIVVQTHGYADEETPLLIAVHNDLPPGTHVVPVNQPQQRQRKRVAVALAGMFFFRVGALFGASAVALGAFGAHGLKKRISDPVKLQNWQTAAHYQLAHSVAMLAARGNPVASTFFIAGMTMFSGSIYALTLDVERFRWAGPVTPIGGICLILGWLTLVFSRGRIQL